MGNGFVQTPPDSSGKRIQTNKNTIEAVEVHTQVMALADRFDPEKQQAVDNQGQAYVRFAGGAPAFNSFGLNLVTEPDLVNVFKFYQSDHAGDFEKKVVGTGDVVFDSSFGGIKFTTGTSATDSVKYTSHRYHHYRPGNGMPLIFTMKAGDSGKTNLERRVGLFDDDNGVFFEGSGGDMWAVIRNSLTGSETKVSRTLWNGDRLDGLGGETNLSGVTVDLTKNNIWWIDFQYLGAGAIRFGTYVNGQKIICHTIGNYGSLDRQWCASPSLPFRAEQTNVGITGSSSEMHIFCVVIENEGYAEVFRETYSISNDITITDTTFVPVLSFQPAQLNLNGVNNRARLLPRIMSKLSATDHVEFQISIGDTLVGATFANNILNCEYDTTATASSGGLSLNKSFVAGGRSSDTDLSNIFDINRDGIWRDADITQSKCITISARLLSAGSSLVGASVDILEIT